jgi:predicted AAA+ superfamily ATPase
MLVANFREDFHKYASKAQIEYLRVLFQSAPRLTGRKFVYSEIDPNFRSRELSMALDLLKDAGLLYKVHHTSAHGLPLGAQINPKKFKVFFLDIGLMQRVLGLNLSQLYIERKELLSHRGPLAEQLVAQEILSYTPQNATPELYYWHREEKSAQAEVDLLFEKNGMLLPIEIKSGKKRPTKSLWSFLGERKNFVTKGIVASISPYVKTQDIDYVPLYAVLLLTETV